MSKNKSKLRWEYVTELFDVLVLPALVKRVHSPLERSLSPHYADGESYLHLRPCVRGVDEYGATVKYLYCTRDGRFFVRGKDGWDEVIPCRHNGSRTNKAVGGSAGCPYLQNFGDKYCHRCVAVAWCNPPAEALAEINDRHTKKKWEVDHLNTDHKNWSADNLQWVTADENRRRAKIACLMRKTGLDPKLLTPTLCKGIYGLPRGWVSLLLGNFLIRCNNDPSQLSVENIRIAVACSLDEIRDIMKHVKCKEPDNKKAL